MKRIDIEKKLKIETEKYTPNPLDKIKQAALAENLLPNKNEHNSEIFVQKNVVAATNKKHQALAIITATLSLVICIILILTFALNFNKKNPNPSFKLSLTTQDIYGIGAVSGVKLLGNNVAVNALKSFSQVNAIATKKMNATATENSEALVKEQAEKFNQYFTALDSFLGEDIVSTTTEKNLNSNYPYEIKMTINGKDLAGKIITYVMYYTETATQSNDEDDEIEYKLYGVIIIDEIEYKLEGERSVETEKDETENELKIRAYANPEDTTSYIQMEQELSVENGETETEYVYSIYSNGTLLEQTAVEFEVEEKNGKVETEYQLEFRNGSAKGKYIVKREVNGGQAEIKVSYNIDGKLGEFRIREITNSTGDKSYEYSFEDNDKIIF